MDFVTELRALGSVALAMGMGAVIGFERELLDKPAGTRTHMLVAGAAAMLILLSEVLVAGFGQNLEASFIRSDPIRIIEAIATGVAFLGAGTIIRQGKGTIVHGLTTAATLLFTAAMGIAVALGELILATGAMILGLITLRLVRMLEITLQHKGKNSGSSKTTH
jgi:putative Mg2+ transporter-C (MgtC) family protein